MVPAVRPRPVCRPEFLPSALLGEAFGAHAAVEDLVGITRGLCAHRLLLDRRCAAELPVAAERGIDVLIDAAFARRRRIGLGIAVAQFAGNRLVVGACFDPFNLGGGRGSADREQQGSEEGTQASQTSIASHLDPPFRREML